ncbi:hypothetical protein GQ55_9G069700 [Panicum hallii var. hallii]|uniref:Uncharacterized protein n=1 Tax=Panicum hallii var. hallii TaxID=1504633 RepID=A0A2T7C0T0_9POAL|nr:hypothetical protein GQ55_9G069700 [Panicum hallii var. hallii]
MRDSCVDRRQTTVQYFALKTTIVAYADSPQPSLHTQSPKSPSLSSLSADPFCHAALHLHGYTCLTYPAHATPPKSPPPARPPEHRTEPTRARPAQQRLAATGKAKFPVTSERLPAATGQSGRAPAAACFPWWAATAKGLGRSATARTRGSGREGTGQGQPATHGLLYTPPPPPPAFRLF